MDVSSPLSWMCCLIWCNLPADLIIEVLCRLPHKSLLRFKCVSKEWNFFITKICFPRLVPLSAFLFMRANCIHVYYVITSEGHKDTEFVLSCTETLPATGHPFIEPKINWVDFVGCFNGLILISAWFDPVKLYVCNPATRQCVSIPVNPNHIMGTKTTMSLAFNPDNNTYKIVRIEYSSDGSTLLPNFEVFSSVTAKWSSFRILLERQFMDSRWVPRYVYLNENLYMLSSSTHLSCFDLHGTDGKKFSISTIELPVKEDDHQIGSISLSNECLYYSGVEQSILQIWSLETDRNKATSPWVPRYRVSMEKLRQLQYGEHLSAPYLLFAIDPTESDVIYLGSPHVVLKYNLQTNKLELFHQMMEGETINGRKYFYAYRRNLVILPDSHA